MSGLIGEDCSEFGVLFVAGFAEQRPGTTIVSFAGAVYRWLFRWNATPRMPQASPPTLSQTALSGALSANDGPAHAILTVPLGLSTGKREARWLLAESSWADLFTPPRFLGIARWIWKVSTCLLVLQFVIPSRRHWHRARRADKSWHRRQADRAIAVCYLGLMAVAAMASVLLSLVLLARTGRSGHGSGWAKVWSSCQAVDTRQRSFRWRRSPHGSHPPLHGGLAGAIPSRWGRMAQVKKYILFDHDGVLVDTEHWYYKAGERALAEIGLPLDPDQYLLDMSQGAGTWAQAKAAGVDVPADRGNRDRGRRRGPRRTVAPDPEPYLTALNRFGAPKEEALVVEDSSRGLHSAVAAGIDCAIVYNEFTKSHDFSQAHYRIRTLAELKDIVLRAS